MSEFEFKAFEKYEKDLKNLEEKQLISINRKSVNLIAARYLRDVNLITPVGNYPQGKGRVGGTLRRGWTIDGLAKKRGNAYEVDVINPVEYASYVNFGHRTRGGGFVEGQFFAEKAAGQTTREVQKDLEKLVAREIRGALRGN